LKGAGGGIGVDVPDDVFDLVPKKSGTPEVVVDTSFSVAEDEEGFPIPNPRLFFGPSDGGSLRPPKKDEAGLAGGASFPFIGVSRKKPSEGG